MKHKIIICISGGLVSAVATTLSECTYIVADYDNDAISEAPVVLSQPEDQHQTFEDGKAHLIFRDMLSTDEELLTADLLEQINY